MEVLEHLAGVPHLAPRVRSLVEVPLSFVALQDRGFHFDMSDALSRLYPSPDGGLVREIAHRLADVCRCLQTTAPCIRYSASGLCQSVAEQLHSELALYKHSSEKGAPCQLLIIGRSIDLPAALVHEFTYEAMAYDLLDGEVLDVDQHIVTMRNDLSSPQDHAMEVRRGNSYKNKSTNTALMKPLKIRRFPGRCSAQTRARSGNG